MIRKFSAVFASAALVMSTFAPAVLADDTTTISGNGSSSTNSVILESTDTSTVVQNNTATISNNITSNVTTGGNQANDNTNGTVAVGTGNATSLVDVSTTVNSNRLLPSTTASSNTTTTITDNGSGSLNTATSSQVSDTSYYQDNAATVNNAVASDASTGNNFADRNTGGDVALITGHAANDVSVSTMANANEILPSMTNGAASGALNTTISGNGSSSTNTATSVRSRIGTVVQSNNAFINNAVAASTNTGNNFANDNTNGFVTVDTGMASALVTVDNLANFNVASLPAGWPSSTGTQILGNGSGSLNVFAAFRDSDLAVFQGGDNENGSLLSLSNSVASDPSTGFNLTNRNTGTSDQVLLVTGHAQSQTAVSNVGNENVFGTGTVQLPGGLLLNLHFNLNNLF